MTKQRFESMPEKVLDLGTGFFNAHFNITEVDEWITDKESGEAQQVKQYEAEVMRIDKLDYGHIVSKLIRRKYSLDDEMAIHRQKDDKELEWWYYYNYCEQCKQAARELLGIEK